jgi:hypothetical protein
MNNVFLCSSATQLIAYKLLYNYGVIKNLPSVGNVVVYVNNIFCNDKCKKNISFYAEKLGYKQSCFNIKDLLNVAPHPQNISLISRRNTSNQELLSLVEYFKIIQHYTIEDGVGDYVKEEFYRMTTSSYKVREFKAKVVKLLSLLFKSIFSHSKYFKLLKINCCNKSKKSLELITKMPNVDKDFCSYYQRTCSNQQNKIKVIFLGSLYDSDSRKNMLYAENIYNKVNIELEKVKIIGGEILYIPHPRSNKDVSNFVNDKLKWSVNNKIKLAEEAICFFNDAEIWSIGSTSQVYALKILNRNCTIVESPGLLKHPSIKNIGKYIVSLGAKRIHLKS